MAKSRKAIRKQTSYVRSSFEGSIAAALQKFGDDISAKAIRPASRAGALVFYNEMRQRVPVGEEHDGSSNKSPGTLFDSIYHAYSKEESTNGKQVYHIGPNKRIAPHWHFTENGHYRVNVVEYFGTKLRATKERLPSPVWIPAKPWITPTYETKVQTAITAMRDRMREKISEIQSGGQN